ncbi:Fur family transcriptional regulator [Kitasatospora paracochleata]|uniref:Fur family ferric uptake transcriptional regulator n=1 Tax=Kitasatospora paracochleata TaxID=58354 RepID=A0ABT1IWD5_9ACTN|nr:Fur family transcriptional regulator [Kitasatospora paracochleata]MCP2309460.1 Fur family ferric uptake transcriptional regulator [Kitasatospora paracochleata]
MPRKRQTAAPGWKETPQRVLVRQALAASPGFITAQLLHARMIAAGATVGLSTVYRALAALTAAGYADTVRDDAGERHYRHRPGADHRHYLICRHCGHSFAVDSGPVEKWAERVVRQSGFTDVHHTVELAGTCTDCTGTRSDGP